MIALAPVKAFFAANRLYAYAAAILGVIILLSGCYIGVTKAYHSIYDSGFEAGKQAVLAENQAKVIQAQQKAFDLQTKLTAQGAKYDELFDLYARLEQASPEEVIKYVRQDPTFAASRRPAAAHALRVRELQQLRETAATHGD